MADGCPATCPMPDDQCQNGVICPMKDENGCTVADFCLMSEILGRNGLPCQSYCPEQCPAGEIHCDPLWDENGCPKPQKCVKCPCECSAQVFEPNGCRILSTDVISPTLCAQVHGEYCELGYDERVSFWPFLRSLNEQGFTHVRVK